MSEAGGMGSGPGAPPPAAGSSGSPSTGSPAVRDTGWTAAVRSRLEGFRMRDTVIGFGDLRRLYRRYTEATGTDVDLGALEYFHFAFALTTQLALQGASAEPGPETDLMTYRHWCSESNL